MAVAATTYLETSFDFHPRLKIKASLSWEDGRLSPDNQDFLKWHCFYQTMKYFVLSSWIVKNWISDKRRLLILNLNCADLDDYLRRKNLWSGRFLFPDLLCSCVHHSGQTTELLDLSLEIFSWQYHDYLISMTSCATRLKPSFSQFILIVLLYFLFVFHKIVCDDGC
jgi:hypothetical protein